MAPILYRSTSLTASQRNWSTLDKEFYALRIAIRKFKFYIHQVDSVKVEVDHKNLIPLLQNPDPSEKHSRWRTDMQGSNLIISYIEGIKNEVADYLSRFPVPNDSARQC